MPSLADVAETNKAWAFCFAALATSWASPGEASSRAPTPAAVRAPAVVAATGAAPATSKKVAAAAVISHNGDVEPTLLVCTADHVSAVHAESRGDRSAQGDLVGERVVIGISKEGATLRGVVVEMVIDGQSQVAHAMTEQRRLIRWRRGRRR